MNITGGVVLGLLYLLPGILFVFGLQRLFSTKKPSPFDGHLSTGLILALPAAALLHTIWIGLTVLVGKLVCSQLKPDMEQALTLLLSDSRSQGHIDAIANSGKYWFQISIYFLTLFVASFAFGKCANRLLKKNERADWYALLRHEADILWLTADIQIGGTAYLFAGALIDFRLSPEGELERVVLTGAVRRTLKRPTYEEIESGEEKYEAGGWIQIPGEHVVLEMKGSKSVNIDYWYLEHDVSSEPPVQPASMMDNLPHWAR